MVRFIPIILCILLALVSGIVLALGFQALEQNARLLDHPAEFTCKALLEEPPSQTQQIEFSKFRVSPRAATLDFDGDGKWDEVYVCAFPTTKRVPKKNYYAAIINVGNVTNQQELDAVFEKNSEPKEMFFWHNKQALSDHAHGELAMKYKSMNFSRCVTLHANYPPPTDDMGEMFILLGKGGLALSAILFVLYLLFKILVRIIPKRKYEFDDDPEPEETRNRAGLPSM
jgi:hypothetical protein